MAATVGAMPFLTNNLRKARAFSKRDLEALRFIGEGYEVAQYQLHEAVFKNRSATVVSRFVVRATGRKLVVSERQDRTGINRLRLTTRGKALLTDEGFAHEDELYVPKAGVALKDLAHTLWINDLRVAVNRLTPPPCLALPAWALQRRFQPAPEAIPDLLALWKGTTERTGLALACEIDMGGEGLPVLIPKLERLFDLVENWAAPSVGLVLVLCRGRKRKTSICEEMIRRRISRQHVAFEACVLPERAGNQQVEALSEMCREFTAPILLASAPFAPALAQPIEIISLSQDGSGPPKPSPPTRLGGPVRLP